MSLPFHFARSITTTSTPLEGNASGGRSGALTPSRLRATFGNVAPSAIPRPSIRTEGTDPTSIHQTAGFQNWDRLPPHPIRSTAETPTHKILSAPAATYAAST